MAQCLCKDLTLAKSERFKQIDHLVSPPSLWRAAVMNYRHLFHRGRKVKLVISSNKTWAQGLDWTV
jgi:hypothetical protein